MHSIPESLFHFRNLSFKSSTFQQHPYTLPSVGKDIYSLTIQPLLHDLVEAFLIGISLLVYINQVILYYANLLPKLLPLCRYVLS